jgi:hypothetical protein
MISGLSGGQDSEKEAGSVTSGSLPQTGEGFVSEPVHCEAAPKDDGHARIAGFGSLHQGSTTSGGLPTLPATFRELSEERRMLSASVRTADLRSRQEGHQLGPERQRQLLRDLNAQGRNFASDSCEGTGADPVSSERTRLRIRGEVVTLFRKTRGCCTRWRRRYACSRAAQGRWLWWAQG